MPKVPSARQPAMRSRVLARATNGRASKTRSDAFDLGEYNVEAFAGDEWEALERLAAGDAEDARWVRCPNCEGRAVLFEDDELVICLAFAGCSQAEIEEAAREDEIGEMEDSFDLGSAE